MQETSVDALVQSTLKYTLDVVLDSSFCSCVAFCGCSNFSSLSVCFHIPSLCSLKIFFSILFILSCKSGLSFVSLACPASLSVSNRISPFLFSVSEIRTKTHSLTLSLSGKQPSVPHSSEAFLAEP